MVDDAAVKAVLDALDPDELLTYARALLAAPSENPGGTEDEAAGVAADILSGLGAEPQMVRGDAGRPSVVATLGAGHGPSLAWNGHLDTVPRGLARHVVGSALRGRGRRRAPHRARRLRHEGAHRGGARGGLGAPRSGRRSPARSRSTWPPTRSSPACTARRSCGSAACSPRTPRSSASPASWHSASRSGAAHGSRRPPTARPRTDRSRTGASTRSRRWPATSSVCRRSCPTASIPLVRPPHGERRADPGRQRTERGARPLHGRHRPADRPRANRPGARCWRPSGARGRPARERSGPGCRASRLREWTDAAEAPRGQRAIAELARAAVEAQTGVGPADVGSPASPTRASTSTRRRSPP